MERPTDLAARTVLEILLPKYEDESPDFESAVEHCIVEYKMTRDEAVSYVDDLYERYRP